MLKENQLRTYQQAGIKFIIDTMKCGLFLDMGLGKTATTLTAFKRLKYNFEATKALVIAPKRVAETVWVDEVANWEHLQNLKVEAIFGTPLQRIAKLKTRADIHTISIDNAQWLLGYKGSFNDYDVIIFDESSLMKNPDTKRFKILKKAILSVPRVILLTGTPTPNSLLELWPQIYLLDGGLRLQKNITSFRRMYAEQKFNGFGYQVKKGFDKHIVSAIKDICMSIRAKDYGIEQQVIFNSIKVNLSQKETQDYRIFEEESYLNFVNETENNSQILAINAAVLNGKLMQYANGAIYDSERKVHHIHEAKIGALTSLFSEINTPILVAYNFDFDKKRILELGVKMGKRIEAFTHSSQVARWNAREIDVLVMHPKSGGHGLNLQFGGHNIVWFGSTYSLEEKQQLNARLVRSGQTETVVVHNIITVGTIEEVIEVKLKSKDHVQNEVLNYLKEKYKK
jgi:hypothetical protein